MSLFAALLLVCMTLCQWAEARSVFAHFMTQNSYSYSVSDWTNDMNTAIATKIDGFVLNTATNSYEVDRMVDAFTAAEALNFKLFISFDMSYDWQETDMVSLVATHASSSSYFRWNNNPLVSTYSGEGNGDAFWSSFKSTLAARGITVTLAPAFTSYRDPSLANSLLSSFPSIDGFFNWWSWPADTNTELTTDTDLAYQTAIKSRTGPYIMSVSPWQFKDIDPSNPDDNWVEQSDTLWNYRWLQAIQTVVPDIVEIVTWNDYAESHYIGDINPNVDLGDYAPNYVPGFTHEPWRIIAEYYIQYYKNGVAPTVGEDQVVFWYRAHRKDVTCSGGVLPRNSNFPADQIFAVALLIDSATISLDIGSTHAQFNAGPGATLGSIDFPSEDSQIPFIQIIKNGVTTASGYGSVFITESCSWYNFNPFVGVVSE